VVREACRCIEASWERGFRDGRLVDLRVALRSLPLIVQTAVRVHDRREGQALVFGLDLAGPRGHLERRVVVVARWQRCVLLFSARGVLDAAGRLRDAPSAPVDWGARWTRIDWDEAPHERDWY
jgi:hypothetical protein